MKFRKESPLYQGRHIKITKKHTGDLTFFFGTIYPFDTEKLSGCSVCSDRSPIGGQLFAIWRSIVRQLANDRPPYGERSMCREEGATSCRQTSYLLPKKKVRSPVSLRDGMKKKAGLY
jgi:hypothetical protein